MKKISIFVAIILILQSVCFATEYPQRFYDVPKEHWAFEPIAELVNRGTINGYEDGSYKPNNTVTRAEWSVIMIKAANKSLGNETPMFSDMAGHWANPYVNAARQYMTSYAGGTEFRPDIAAMREDVTVAMVKLKGYSVDDADFSYISKFKDQDSISASCKKYVAVAVEKGLINGFEDNTFRGQDTLTRAEAARLLWVAFQKGNEDKVVEDTQQKISFVEEAVPQKAVSDIITEKKTENDAETIAEPDIDDSNKQELKPYVLDTVVYAKDVTSIIQDGNCIYFIDGDTVYSYQDGNKSILTTESDLLSRAPEAGVRIDDAYGTTILPEDKPDECYLLSLIYDYDNNLPFLFVSYGYGGEAYSGRYAGLFEAYLLTDMSKPYISSDELLTPFYNVGVSEPTSCTIENSAIYYKIYNTINRFDLKTGVSSSWKGDSTFGKVYQSINAFKINNAIFGDGGVYWDFIKFDVKNSDSAEAVKYAVVNGNLYFFDKNMSFFKVTNLEPDRAEKVVSIDDVDIMDGKGINTPREMKKSEMFYDGSNVIIFFDENNKSIRQISKR